MRSIVAVDTLQIHTTNACVLQCSGCTHLCGHHKKPYMMTLDEFKAVIDSLKGFPKMIGMIGGEPTLVPWFEEQARYARSRFPREQLGLWSVFPEGEKYSKYGPVIAECFGNIFLNDHSVGNIMHAPILVASGEFFENKGDLSLAADACWVQNAWSPGITPKGAFFCEVAAELDQLFGGPGGWDISEPEWWKRTPKDYTEQIERSCSKCGACMPLARKSSQDEVCEVSEGNAILLKGKSRKVDNGLVNIQKKGEFKMDQRLLQGNGYPDQSPYKNENYRQVIAARYGLRLIMNRSGCWDPQLAPQGWKPADPPKPLFEIFQQGSYPGKELTAK